MQTHFVVPQGRSNPFLPSLCHPAPSAKVPLTLMTPMDTALQGRISFAPVSQDDFEELLALRIAAMRESLEAVGRFNPERARERLRKSFYPEHTAFIAFDGQRIGFYTFRPADGGGFQLDHLYVHPTFHPKESAQKSCATSLPWPTPAG